MNSLIGYTNCDAYLMNTDAYIMNQLHILINHNNHMINIETYYMIHFMAFNNIFPILKNIVFVL
jgi:hypothetical protein